MGKLTPPPMCALTSSIADAVPGAASATAATNRAYSAMLVFFMDGLLSIESVPGSADYRTGPRRTATGAPARPRPGGFAAVQGARPQRAVAPPQEEPAPAVQP
jgi:hypothetical protein